MLASRQLLSLGVALLAAGPLHAAQDARSASWPGALPGVRNAREVSGLTGKEGGRLQRRILVRSGALSHATPQALASLQAYGVKTVVDLRTNEEIAQAGADPPPFGRKPLLVRLPTDLETWIGNEVHRCEELWDQNGHVTAAVLSLLADPDNFPILVHGQAGVERTGILVAAVLEIAGVPRHVILDDYVRNDGSRRPLQAGLEAVFTLWDAHKGGLAGWLEEEAGVHPLVLEAVRRNLLHPEAAGDARDRKAAATLLKKAEKEAAGGRYSAAVKDYQKLAKKYPRTSAGIVGAVRSQPNAFLGWAPLVIHGPSRNRVDVVFMGEGYTLDNMKSFDKAVKNVPRMFEKHGLFGEYYSYFNFLRASLRSEEDGVDMAGRTYSTVLNGHDSGASQGQVAVDNDLAQRMLEEMPDNDQLAAVFVAEFMFSKRRLGRGS
ncbi:MAG: tyrosine-protein phosphatase [Planctomycetota bacterium]